MLFRSYCDESGGLFDITIAPLILLWNVTADNPEIPSADTIEKAKNLVDYRQIAFDEQAKSVMLLKPGMSIDLGGIAKGMAAADMGEIVKQYKAEGYLSIGGNMLVEGKKPDGSDFLIGIRDPRGEGQETVAAIKMDGLTMATTGDYERYFELDGIRYHHIMDPFTGYPGQTDFISVSVLSENGALADYLSTTIFLKGSENLEQYLTRDDCMILAVTQEKKVYASERLWERITVNEQKTDYTFCREWPSGE